VGGIACTSSTAPPPGTTYQYDAPTFGNPDGVTDAKADAGALPNDATGTSGVDAGAGPCSPNPCKEANKTICAKDGTTGHVCYCNDGFEDKDGKCVPACKLPDPPPKPPVLKPGDLLIVELMINPQATQDDVGEWFEIRNMTNKDLDLRGMIITEAEEFDKHVINSCKPVMLKAGGVIAMGRTGDAAKNGGYTPGYVYKNVTLSNLSDDLLLQSRDKDGKTVNIDHVNWDKEWAINLYSGKALALDASQTTASGNDKRDNWCLAVEKMSGGDFGTPGVMNKVCPVPADTDKDGHVDTIDNCPKHANKDQSDEDKDGVGDVCDNCVKVGNKDQANADGDKKGDACDPSVCGDAELDAGEQCDDGNLLGNDGCEGCLAKAPIPGKIVISEIMVWAGANETQWFEVYNPTTTSVAINGWTIEIGKGFDEKGIKHTINHLGALTVAAGGRLVIAASPDASKNGGIKADYTFNDKGGKKLEFNLSGDSITIIDPLANAVVDKVVFAYNNLLQTSLAWQLDPTFHSSTANDTQAYWCNASTQFPKAPALYGTPGAKNTSCVPPGKDKDGDATSNEQDNCPFHSNPQQTDGDKDKIGDACDNCKSKPNGDQKDSDADGVGDACDNCPLKPNVDQKDDDKNGLGNACDPKDCGNNKLDANEDCDDGNKKSGDGCSESCQKEFYSPGAVIITEMLVQPQWSTDPTGEWIELYNPGTKPVDINGWILRDNGANVHVITKKGGLVVAPGSYLVLGNNDNINQNGGVLVNYAWGKKDKPPTLFTLSNPPFSDEVVLTWNNNQIIIDQVSYKPKGWACAQQPQPKDCQNIGFDIKPGKALSLSPDKFTHLTNDAYQSWCPAKKSYGLGDFGTPGKPNPSCINPCKGKADNTVCGKPADKTHCIKQKCVLQPQCGDKIVQPKLGEDCDDGNKNNCDGCSDKCKNIPLCPPPGTLIISEIMPDPDAVDDNNGEWFELFNPSSAAVDINGWSIISGVKSHQIKAGAGKKLMVAAQGRAVLAGSSFKTLNNGINALYGWNDATKGSFGIDDKKTTPISLLNTKGIMVDTVTLNGPWKTGVSTMLKTGKCHATSENDKASCWESATSKCTYGHLVGKAGLDPKTCKGKTCKLDKDCGNANLVCKNIGVDFEGQLICAVKPPNTPGSSFTCVIAEQGTPGAANTCK